MKIRTAAAAIAAAALTLGGLALAAPALADDPTTTQEVASSPDSTQPDSTIATSPDPAAPVDTSANESTTATSEDPATSAASPSSDAASTPPTETTPEPSTTTSGPTETATPSAERQAPVISEWNTFLITAAGAPPLGHVSLGAEWFTPRQTFLATGQVQPACGQYAQQDLDRGTRAAIDTVIANGIGWANGRADDQDHVSVDDWVIVYGGDCPVPPGPANGSANIQSVCAEQGGSDVHIILENDGENILTASFVVYVDGEFNQAAAVAAGEHQDIDLSFAEDSGEHTVTVRTGPAQGDEELATATVGTDCLPAVVTPPTETPAPTTAAPAPTPAAVAAPAAAVVSDDELAHTGSNEGALALGLAGGAAVLLAGGVWLFALRTRRDRKAGN